MVKAEHYPAELIERRDVSASLAVFRFLLAEQPTFTAGQYATIGVVYLTYVPTISRPWEEPKWKGETGRVEDIVRKHTDKIGIDHTNSIAYACGHPRMVENVKEILARTGFRKEQIREEEYLKLHDLPSRTDNGRASIRRPDNCLPS